VPLLLPMHVWCGVRRCRAQRARLSGHDSFNAMTQQSLQGLQAEAAAASSSSSQDGTEYRIAFLLKLQQALEPLCQQEVAWVANQASRQQVDQQGKPGDNQQQQQQLSSQQQQQQQQHDSPQHAGCGIDILPAAATSNNTGHSSGHIPEQGAGGPAHVQIDTSSSIAQQSGPADWDYMLHQAALPYSQSLQREAGVLQQHLQLPGVVEGFSSLLQDLIGVRLVPRPPPPPAAAAAAADLWVPHIFVLDLFDTWGSQNEVESSDDDRQQGGMAADSSQHMYRSQQGGRVGQLLGTVYLDIGGGYGTRMLRYARKVPGSSSSTAAGCAANLMFPAVAVGISGGRLPPVPQQGQREGAASTVAPAAAAAAAAVQVLLHIKPGRQEEGSCIQQQQQQQQLTTHAWPVLPQSRLLLYMQRRLQEGARLSPGMPACQCLSSGSWLMSWDMLCIWWPAAGEGYVSLSHSHPALAGADAHTYYVLPACPVSLPPCTCWCCCTHNPLRDHLSIGAACDLVTSSR
jgi:hypothetical protein